MFLGWYPPQDLQNANQMPAAVQSCFAFFEKQGISITTGNARSQAEGVCSDIDYFTAALKAAPAIAPAGLIEGAERIDSSYRPIGTFGISVTPGQRDGVSAIRRGACVSSCDCYEYTSGDIPVA